MKKFSQKMTYLINNKGVCITVPATRGLFTTWDSFKILVRFKGLCCQEREKKLTFHKEATRKGC